MATVPVVDSLKYGLQLFGYLLGIVVIGGGGMVLGGVIAGNELTDGFTTSPELFGGVVLAGLGVVIWFTGMFGLSYKLIADATRWGVSSGTDSLSGGVPERSEETTERTETQRVAHPDSSTRGTPVQQRGVEPTETGPIGPSPGEQVSGRSGPAVPASADVPDRAVSETEPGPASSQPTGPDNSQPSDQPETVEADNTSSPDRADETERDRSESADVRQKQDSSEPPEPTAGEIVFGPGEDDGEDVSQTEGEESQPARETEPEPETEGTIPPYDSIAESGDDEKQPPSVDDLFSESATGENDTGTGEDETSSTPDEADLDETTAEGETDPLSDPVDEES